MAHWLFKSEPSTYSIDDLATDHREWWDGIRNYQARNFMMHTIAVGDEVLFYHSSCPFPGAVGTAKVCAAAKPDPTQFDKNSPYYDPRSDVLKPRWHCVQIEFVSKFERLFSLSQMRTTKALAEMMILKRGNRLSITPLTLAEWKAILQFTQQH